MIDEETFVQETRAMERTLYRVSRGYLSSWEDCADAVQEALAKAWAKRHRAQPEYFRAWLTRIVINECRNVQRHRRRVTPVEEVWPEADTVPEAGNTLRESLSALPEQLRVPLTLHYLEGFSLEEIAKTLCLPVGTIKSRLHKARKTLRIQLEEDER